MRVSVPVLSQHSMSIQAAASNPASDLTIIPSLGAPPQAAGGHEVVMLPSEWRLVATEPSIA